MDEPATVFYLIPIDEDAARIIDDGANHDRRRMDPNNASKRYLRIGLDQPAKIPSRLVTFSRTRSNGDVVLNARFSNTDQCYFDFHPTTGELLLHDISKNDDTQLYSADEQDSKQIWRSPRQCVVPLDSVWIFKIGHARFHLVPRRAPSKEDETAFTAERLAFVHQIPEEFRTFQGALEGLEALGMQSDVSTITAKSYDLRRLHPDRLKPGGEIRYAHRRDLGAGGQGTVDVVVNLHTGEYYARKVVPFKEIPEWGLHNESDFKARVWKEVDLVKKVRYDHIVPYLHHQGWETGQVLEIFMPVYEGNLLNLLGQLRRERARPEAVRAKTDRMLHQILLALDHVHMRGIIHRDVKPANILYQGDDFLLTDFGIAKAVDTSRTMAGTKWYTAPEIIWRNGEQTAKVDIYSLGATVVECLVELPPEAEREARWPQWHQWHRDLQTVINQLEPRMAPMLADVADQRPTASQLLQDFSRQSPYTSLRGPQTNTTLSSPSLFTNQSNGTTVIYSAPTAMDWTQTGVTALSQENLRQRNEQPLQPDSVAVQSKKAFPNRHAQPEVRRKRSIKSVRSAMSTKSTDERQNKGHKRNGASQNGRYIPSQFAGIPKRISSTRSRRSRSKSILKAEEIRALETT